MSIKKLSTPINFVLFQACWFACVWGGANNYGWLGPVLVAITVPLQVYFITENHKAETFFVIISGLSGFVLETILILAGVYFLAGQSNLQICPPWMAALWFNFAMLVSISLVWLKEKYLLAAILGGLAGPVAYWGGEKLGAITVADAFMRGYVPLMLLWAIALPCFVYVHSRMALQKQN